MQEDLNMDKAIQDYLNNLVNKCVNSSHFSALGEDEKKQVGEKVQRHFNNIVIDALLDRLTQQQMDEIKNLDPNSKEMQEKLQTFAAGIPNFAQFLEQKLNDEATRITQTGHVPS